MKKHWTSYVKANNFGEVRRSAPLNPEVRGLHFSISTSQC